MEIIARAQSPMLLMCCIPAFYFDSQACLLHQGSRRQTTGDSDITAAATGTGAPSVDMDQVFTMHVIVEIPD